MTTQYIVIIYSGATNKGANNALATYIANGVKKAGISVYGPVDVNLLSTNDKNKLYDIIDKSNGLIVGTGDYNGNIEPELLKFFDTVLGPGFKNSFLSSKVAGQFVTAGDAGTGAQPILNDLSRLMMTFGANIMSGGSWHMSQGMVGIVDSKTNTFTSKYIDEDAEEYGERIGKIATFFTNQYKQEFNLSDVEPGTTLNYDHVYNNKNHKHHKHHKHHKCDKYNAWLITLIVIIVILLLGICGYFSYLKR